MKKLFLSGVAAAAILSAPALAADMPVKAAPPVPGFSWTGCYIGGQVGYGWGRTREAFNNGTPTGNYDTDGWLGGGHLGCNYQSGGLVLGLEGDYEAADLRGSFSNLANGTSGGTAHMKSDDSIRGRIGVAWDRSLFYFTGGWASARYDVAGGPAPQAAIGPFNTLTANRHAGTIGGGWEYAFAPNWSARVEYRHTDYGTFQGVLPTYGVIMSAHNKTDVVRVGLTYRFGGDPWGKAPVVAKY